MKSAQRDANTARPPQSPHRRTESAMAVVRQSQKIFPAADPLPGGAGPPKFNQLEMVTTCTYRLSLVKIDARNFELSW